MINLDDIKGRSAMSLLEDYSGINPYLKKLRNEYLKNKKILLTEAQTKYIIENHDKEPILINTCYAKHVSKKKMKNYKNKITCHLYQKNYLLNIF